MDSLIPVIGGVMGRWKQFYSSVQSGANHHGDRKTTASEDANNNSNNSKTINDQNNNDDDNNAVAQSGICAAREGLLSVLGDQGTLADIGKCLVVNGNGAANMILAALTKFRREVELTQMINLPVSLSNYVVNQIADFIFLDENKKQVDNVTLIDRYNSRKQIKGTFYITSTHVIFVDPEGRKEVWISHMHIASLEKHPATSSGHPLQIRGKNFMNAVFIVPKEKDCQDVYLTLTALCRPATLEDLYAFSYSGNDASKKRDGWDYYDLQSEYLRMGVPNENWSLSTINKEYELCDTYPKHLFVPATSSTPMLISSAKFRSRGRLPVLSYLHRFNQASICRCSQPLAGFSARCLEDESLFQAIRKSNPSSKFIFVVDTRPRINALANRATGKGYESESFYSNVKFHFCSIENIHVVRSSLQKLVEVCEMQNPSMSAFLGGLESSGWLRHIKSIIDTSVFVAKAIQDNVSVIVHCSDGWDRTAQVTSLSSLMLDPYYRTINGFQALIEKDWLAFGHKFTERCGFTRNNDPKEMSPIFTQFLDCVWQLKQQFPRSFEFNERFLMTIHDHVYSCQFGTFIGCCEKDRIDLRLKERTYSLWGYTSKYTRDFSNPFYKKNLQVSMPVIIPVTNPQSVRLWRAMYCRYENGIHPRESITDIIHALKDHTESLENHRRLLEKRISALWSALGYKFTEESMERTLQQITSSDSIDFRSFFVDPEKNEVIRTGGQKIGDLGSDPREAKKDGQAEVINSFLDQKRLSNLLPQAERTTVKDSNAEVETVPLDVLLVELNSVALDWKSLRGALSCSCAMPFEQHSMKNHCWSCGDVYCTRCIDRYTHLPGHLDEKDVPVCKSCFRFICSSPPLSVDDFQKLQENV